ncbi:hypothetical protein [Plantactinospora sonchi]|uniref:Glycosyltransferase n=1 Tax=Plantactinospora sonchi TaxID=1544735 RepID=A0ABU7RR83_9ACTN
MTRRVLFLALGGNRPRGVAAESAEVVAAGGRAVVLVDHLGPWHGPRLDPAVEVVELSRLESARRSTRLVRAMLYGLPHGLFTVIAQGPLRQPARRARERYDTRFADRVHRRFVLPRYRPGWGAEIPSGLRRHLPDADGLDLIVVADAVSLPYGLGLLTAYRAAGVAEPALTFGLEYAVPSGRLR